MTTTTSPPRSRRAPLWSWFAAAMSGIAIVLLAIAIAGFVADDDPAGPEIMSAEEAAASGLPQIRLGEMYIEGDLSVDVDAVVSVVNEGVVPHNLTVENGPATPDLDGGQATEFDLAGLEPTTYTVFCSIPGHREAGMEAVLSIGSGTQ